MAIAANKSDMYEFEEVPEEEGMALAKQINAIFQTTTAKDKNGSIDQLFMNLGKKFLHPNMENTTNLTKDELKNKGIQINQQKGKNGKKKTSRVSGDIHYRQFEESLIEALGTKVRIVSKNDNVGKIEIDYYSLDDLDRICDLLQGKNESENIDTAPWLKTKFPV